VVQHRVAEQGEARVKRGFTLVEMMLAVALLSIIVTVIYSSFHTLGRIMRRTERTKGAYQAARLVMSRMREDLSCAYFSPTRKNFVFKGEDIEGIKDDAGADALTFVTTAHVISGRDVPEGDLAEVSYYLDEENRGLLVRREDVSPDSKLEMGGNFDILGKNVVGLNFTYLDGREEPARRAGGTTTDLDKAEEEKKAWKYEWDSEQTPYLPRAVKVDLSVLNEEGDVQDFSTTILLAMGRTATSTQPSDPNRVAPPRARRGTPRGGQPSRLGPSGPRDRRGGERGDRRDSGPRRGRDQGRGGNQGSGSGPRTPRSGGGDRRPSAPQFQRNAPNAPRRMSPGMPGGTR